MGSKALDKKLKKLDIISISVISESTFGATTIVKFSTIKNIKENILNSIFGGRISFNNNILRINEELELSFILEQIKKVHTICLRRKKLKRINGSK